MMEINMLHGESDQRHQTALERNSHHTRVEERSRERAEIPDRVWETSERVFYRRINHLNGKYLSLSRRFHHQHELINQICWDELTYWLINKNSKEIKVECVWSVNIHGVTGSLYSFYKPLDVVMTSGSETLEPSVSYSCGNWGKSITCWNSDLFIHLKFKSDF